MREAELNGGNMRAPNDFAGNGAYHQMRAALADVQAQEQGR